MTLAIRGGEPVRTKLFPSYRVIGEEEKAAVNRVLESGILSRFLGCWHDDFYGGPEIQALEREWADYFNVKHALAVNSCTSGLYCAVGAAGVEPGDEVIVSPYTMVASATAAVIYHAIPVFADIEEECFCLDPDAVEACITPRTRAIIAVDLFGQPYDAERINAIAKKHNLVVIEDAAQAPGAKYGDQYAGTLGDIGVFSLNYHKHVHCGEGGIVVTDDDELADRVRLIRNHAEAVVGEKNVPDLVNMVGFNFRMTEVEAAIARCQLKKLTELVEKRRANCDYLSERLGEILGIVPPVVREGCTHVYYVHALKFLEEVVGVSRERFIEAVKAELAPTELREAEGVILSCGYVRPIYLEPMYQNKIAFGSKGYPFTAPYYHGTVRYEKGICPVVERIHEQELFSHELMRPPMSKDDLDDVVKSFWKVWEHLDELKV
jgi:perosamine synthetase